MRNKLAVARRAAVLLAGVLFCQQDCPAQADPWDRLRLVEPGKNIDVKLRSGKSLKGKLESWSAEGLQLRKGNEVRSIDKGGVQRVALVAGMSRGRRAMWAGLIGGAAGAGLFGAICASVCDTDSVAVSFLGGAALGALFVGGPAAGIAALIPQHKEVIYVAPEPPGTSRPGSALSRSSQPQESL